MASLFPILLSKKNDADYSWLNGCMSNYFYLLSNMRTYLQTSKRQIVSYDLDFKMKPKIHWKK